MPIYFRSTPVREPFTFDTAGNHWTQERISRPKGYPLYHFLQTEKGQGIFEVQGQLYSLNEGEGILLAPSIPHSYYGLTEKWITEFVTITGTIESHIADMLKNQKILFTSAPQGEKISQIISDSIHEFESSPVNVKSLSTHCYRFLLNFIDGLYTQDLNQEPLYQQYIAPVVKEIETHFADKLTVQDLSAKVFITPQYLSRLFRRFLGSSTYEYLTTHRINKAKEYLLTNPGWDIQHIAGLVGFDDVSHFIVMFKKIAGITPLEFRVLYAYKKK